VAWSGQMPMIAPPEGELGRRAGTPGTLDHLFVLRGDRADRAAEIEVGVDELAQPGRVAGENRRPALDGQLGESGHRLDHLAVSPLVAGAEVVVDHLGRLAHVGAVGNVERRQERGVERLVHAALEAAARLHPLAVEVHVDQAFVHLDHAVLQAGRDPQLLSLHRQHQRRLYPARDLDAVELRQAAERGHDDRAGAGQPDLPGDVGLVADGEIPLVKPLFSGLTVLDEPLDRRLDQPDPAVVAVQLHVVGQLPDRAEAALVFLAPDDLHLVPLVERHLGLEVRHDDRDRLAVVAVRRVADQAGAGVRLLPDQEHGHRSAGPLPRLATYDRNAGP